MSSTQTRGEPLTLYDPEFNKTFRKMNNQGFYNNPVIEEPKERVNNENVQVHDDNLLGDVLRVQAPP